MFRFSKPKTKTKKTIKANPKSRENTLDTLDELEAAAILNFNKAQTNEEKIKAESELKFLNSKKIEIKEKIQNTKIDYMNYGGRSL